MFGFILVYNLTQSDDSVQDFVMVMKMMIIMGVTDEQRNREASYDKDKETVCETIRIYTYGFAPRLVKAEDDA